MTLPILTPQLIVTLIGVAIAAATDLRTGKIFNALTFPMMALGLAMNASLGDPMVGVIGLVAATVLHWSLWRLGVQRGGDAKLMMGVGALMGSNFMLHASGWYAVLYLPIGLAILGMQGKFGNLMKVVVYLAAKAQGEPVGEPPEPTMLITGPIIALGVVGACFTYS